LGHWKYHNIQLQTTLEPQQYKQHGTDTKTDMKISGTEDTDLNPRSDTHLIFVKSAKNI
jgi:hypothetical protein